MLLQHLPQPQAQTEAAEDLELAWHLVFLVFVFVDGSKSPMQCEHALRSNDPSSLVCADWFHQFWVVQK